MSSVLINSTDQNIMNPDELLLPAAVITDLSVDIVSMAGEMTTTTGPMLLLSLSVCMAMHTVMGL